MGSPPACGKDGVTRATIGIGNITLRDVTPAQAADMLAALNRDPTKLRAILRSHDFAAGGELDVAAFAALPENLQASAGRSRR